MRIYVMIAILCLFCGKAMADGPYEIPQGFYLVSNNLAKPVQYSPTSKAANWEVTQSGSTSILPDFIHEGVNWATHDVQEKVIVSNATAGWTETIAQYGAVCAAGEFDSFIQPAAQASKGNYQSLREVAALNVQGTVTLNVAAVSPAPACPDNHASATYGIVLEDNAVYPNQRLSYSLRLFSMCKGNCKTQSKTAAWFWNGQDHVTSVRGVATWNYAVSDVPASFGATQIALTGVKKYYSFNFLPRLKALIAAEGNGIDTDLNDWAVVGDTRGNAEWGSIDFSTTWQRWQMTY
jgi:hypothetical protein